MEPNIFDAARTGNLKAVKACLERSADVMIAQSIEPRPEDPGL